MSERVVLRQWPSGDIIALFPDISTGNGYIDSYEHVGGHGGADYGAVIKRTKPVNADRADAAALLQELRHIGYDLRVIRRR